MTYKQNRTEVNAVDIKTMSEFLNTQLSARDHNVMVYRFGLTGNRPMSLREVGKLMWLSIEGVRHVELDAMVKLRKFLSEKAMRQSKENNTLLERTEIKDVRG